MVGVAHTPLILSLERWRQRQRQEDFCEASETLSPNHHLRVVLSVVSSLGIWGMVLKYEVEWVRGQV